MFIVDRIVDVYITDSSMLVKVRRKGFKRSSERGHKNESHLKVRARNARGNQ